MLVEVRGDGGLVVSCSEHATALLLAREWLRQAAQRGSGAHTCVLQIRDETHRLLADHIISLSDGPLAS